MVTSETTADSGYYLRVARRGWPLVLVGILLGLLAAGGYCLVAQRTYTATASVLVTTTGVDETTAVGQRTVGGDVNLDTEAQLLTSADVVDRVLRETGDTYEATELLSQVEVQVPANTTVLDIAFTATTPELAQRGARAFAEAYLTNRREVAGEAVEQLAASYQSRIDAARDEQKRLQRQAAAAGRARRGAIQGLQQGVAARIAALVEAQITAESTVVTPGRVINQPGLPRSPSSPDVVLVLGSGGALGLLAGLVVAMYVQRTRPRFRDEEDVRRELGLPLLARVPAGDDGRGPVVATPLSAQATAFAQLRRRLEQVRGGTGGRVFVSAVSSEVAAVHTALNLSWQHARHGTPSRLVVASGPPPPGVDLTPHGADDVLVGRYEGEGVVATAAPLTVVEVRGLPEDALLDQAVRAEAAVDAADDAAALEPTAAPVSIVVSDPLADLLDGLAHPADTAVLLVQTGKDRAPEARRVLAALEASGLRVVGVVLHPAYRWRPPAPEDETVPAPEEHPRAAEAPASIRARARTAVARLPWRLGTAR